MTATASWALAQACRSPKPPAAAPGSSALRRPALRAVLLRSKPKGFSLLAGLLSPAREEVLLFRSSNFSFEWPQEEGASHAHLLKKERPWKNPNCLNC